MIDIINTEEEKGVGSLSLLLLESRLLEHYTDKSEAEQVQKNPVLSKRPEY